MRKRKKLSHSNFHQWCLCIVLLMMSLDVTAQIRATKSNAYSGYWKLIKTNITVPKIPKDLKEAVKIIWNLDGVNITLSQAEVLLKTRGYTFQSLAEAVSNAVYLVA